MSEVDDNLFEDNDTEETNTEESAGENQETETSEEEKSEDEEAEGEGKEEPGEEDAETPSAEEGGSTKSEKMIPESRLKAAIKDVETKNAAELTKLRSELAKVTAKPAPDKETDPDGYDLHMRIEISKTVMAETVSDYEDVIAHYQEMAKENPLLNASVSQAKNPAKYAYDIAKKDMRIRELEELDKSDDLKEFRKWKEQQAKNPVDKQLSGKPATTTKVPPNLNNRTAIATSKVSKSSDDDGLFADAVIDGHF